ncbi:ABC transporter substrate-binding protein [uncultured Jatrophihabitans sp.]|uniref:ABC transporter substrate-binding protein n=1 Tax=uncultured Jatrophihabitans sp. TaxID=1610747 RepID=UPI0035CADEDC
MTFQTATRSGVRPSDRVRRASRSRRAGLALMVVALAGSAAACSSSGSGSDGGSTAITVSHGYTLVEGKEIQALAQQWNRANPKSKVTLSFNGGNDSALQKTVAGFTAGNYPDVAYEYGSSAAQLSRQPKLVDMTSTVHAPSFDWNDFYPSEREAATVNGKVVGIPALVDNLSLVYNKKLFADAHVAPPNASWTWQDFRNAARQLTDRSARQYGWAYVNDGSEDTVWRYLAMLWQAGGELLTKDNKKPAFDSPAGKAALQQLHDMAVTDKSVYLDNGSDNYLNLFNSNKIAMLWTGPWDLATINKNVQYGVTLLPGYNGNHETISGPDLWMSFDHSNGRTATARKFIAWLTSAKIGLQFSIATGDLPLRKSSTTLPAYKTFVAKYPSEQVFVQNLNNVKHVRPNIHAYAQVSTAVGQMVQSVLLGQRSPAQALKQGSAQVAGALAGS